MPTVPPASKFDEKTGRQVLQEQVAALYATTWSSTLAGTLLACALSGIFYWRMHNPMVLVWLGLVFLQLLRYPQAAAYHRDPQVARRSEYWARHKARELLIYSCLWGLAPWLFMPADDVPMIALMMLMILGMSTGGVPAVTPRWSTALCFLLPMVLGLTSALLWHGDDVHLFLAACSLVYLGATLHFARQQHLLLTHALLMRFEKEALADELARQVTLTQRTSAEKTRFFAAANHDLRQPVHAIALFGAVLEKDLRGRGGHANAKRLMRAVHMLGTSLDTMLDVSRLDAGVIRPELHDTPVNQVFQSVNQVLSGAADEKGLQLRLRASPLWVRTDPQLLQRMLINLVENAIKYTVAGGVVVVARSRGPQVWMDVCDTGLGIAPEHLEHIFDEFYQVSNPGRDRSQGLGIGLSIVRRLSDLLDHPLVVQSRLGHGSRFRIVVPAAAALEILPPAHLMAGGASDGVFQRPPLSDLPQQVLLIDDEAEIGVAVAALLGSCGVAVTVVQDAAGANAAFEQAATNGVPFDCLICDYRLAEGTDGLQVALSLRARFDPDLPVLLVTGETAPERLQRVRDSGVAVLFKPVPGGTLLTALTAIKHTH